VDAHNAALGRIADAERLRRLPGSRDTRRLAGGGSNPTTASSTPAPDFVQVGCVAFVFGNGVLVQGKRVGSGDLRGLQSRLIPG
jgi:hypothetical protein